MPAPGDGSRLPEGAVSDALVMTEYLSGRGRLLPDLQVQLRAAEARWGHENVIGGFSVLLCAAMDLIDRRADHGDTTRLAFDPQAMHEVVPRVLGKIFELQLRGLPAAALPTVAGILTAAAVGRQTPERWRKRLGPIPQEEQLLWCYTAWALIEIIDTAVGKPGEFAARTSEGLPAAAESRESIMRLLQE